MVFNAFMAVTRFFIYAAVITASTSFTLHCTQHCDLSCFILHSAACSRTSAPRLNSYRSGRITQHISLPLYLLYRLRSWTSLKKRRRDMRRCARIMDLCTRDGSHNAALQRDTVRFMAFLAMLYGPRSGSDARARDTVTAATPRLSSWFLRMVCSIAV